MTKCMPSLLTVSMLALAFLADPAQAQTRVFVAAQGLDSNPCTFAAPCRTFQHAHDVVVAGGEIDVLDPAGYGALTITKAISIQGHGFAGISASSGNAITINAGGTDKISLRGLLIDGVGAGEVGILFNTGGFLDVQDCVIRNFASAAAGHGITFAPNASSKLAVANTAVTNNYAAAIDIEPSAGTTTAVLDRVLLLNNSNGSGVFISGTGTNKVTVSDSVLAFNSGGINAQGSATTVMVRNSTIANNSTALSATGGGILRVTHSTITGNILGLFTSGAGSTIESFGDNSLRGNTTDGAPTSTIPLK